MQEIINHTNREAAAIKKQRQDKEDAQRKVEEYRRLKQEAPAQQVAKAKEEEEKRIEHSHCLSRFLMQGTKMKILSNC